MDLLSKFVHLKWEYLRANHSKFMTKKLSKAIMLRTRFRHQFLKMKTPEAKAKHMCNICDNKRFSATVKPLFSNKTKSAENIVISENGVLIKDEEEVANIFNNFFVSIVSNLGI